MADSFWVIDSEENLTDSCVRASEYYSDVNDSTAFDRGSDELFKTTAAKEHFKKIVVLGKAQYIMAPVCIWTSIPDQKEEGR